jgi:hypothetical protein
MIYTKEEARIYFRRIRIIKKSRSFKGRDFHIWFGNQSVEFYRL